MSNSNRELVLHIGPHKTGSTAIQKVLRQHAEFLESCDVASATLQWDLPSTHKAFSHTDLESVGFLDDLSIAKKDFDQWLSAHDQKYIILSSEDMSRFFTPWSKKARIAKMLFGKFEKITIVVYVRRQDRAYESNYQTWIKRGILVREDGSVKPFMEHVEDPEYGIDRLDWLSGINDYKECFPNAEFKVKCYDLVVETTDIARDFLESIGLNDLPQDVRSTFSNTGLNHVGREIMAIARAELSNEDATHLGVLLEVKYPLTRESSLRGYGLFTREQREKIVTEFHDANQELFEVYSMGDKGDFERWESIEEQTDTQSDDPRYDAVVHLIKAVLDCEKKMKK